MARLHASRRIVLRGACVFFLSLALIVPAFAGAKGIPPDFRYPWKPGSRQAPFSFFHHGGPEGCYMSKRYGHWHNDWCFLLDRPRRAIR